MDARSSVKGAGIVMSGDFPDALLDLDTPQTTLCGGVSLSFCQARHAASWISGTGIVGPLATEGCSVASAVHRVLGLNAVTNRITVKPRAVPAQVEKQITNALARHAQLDARQIHVTTSGTTAILTGHVHSLDEARTAKNAALMAPGISDVEDRLIIQP
jgi:osmotically-inducible protein OsmY